MTEELASYGYDMIGVDNSEEMLEIAMNKKEKSGHDILYLLQDMRQFELYGTVKAIVSVCDCINYIIEEDELEQIFRLVNNYLDPGGIFIFDLNTVHKYRDILGDATIAENREECSFIWENDFDEEEGINEYDLTCLSGGRMRTSMRNMRKPTISGPIPGTGGGADRGGGAEAGGGVRCLHASAAEAGEPAGLFCGQGSPPPGKVVRGPDGG